MWLVTCEDGEGMWWDEPIAASTEESARQLALTKWVKLPDGCALVLWRCDDKGEIERPVST